MSEHPDPDALIRVTDVATMTGLSISSIYDRIGRKEFPEAKQLGSRLVRWKRCEVVAWINALPAAPIRERRRPAQAA